jgi:hypothetical protein
VFAAIGVFVCNYIGRKKILVTGNCFMGMMHILIGVLFIVEKYEGMYICIILYIAGF